MTAVRCKVKKSCGFKNVRSFFNAVLAKPGKSGIAIKKTSRFVKRSIFYFLTTIIVIIGIGLGVYGLVSWNNQNEIIKEEIANVQDAAFEENNQEIEEENEKITEEDIQYENPYWSYLDTDISNINFGNLKEINPQTIAWIKVNNTNINYPVVQTTDNDYYLTHSFGGSYNDSGWVFMDYEDKSDFDNRNTVIYAHGRNEGTMFGTLKNALDPNWYYNDNNQIVTIATENNIMLWKVFSTYRIPVTNDYIVVNFVSDKQFTNFIDTIKSRSNYDYNVPVDKDDKILTLSTCIGADERMVLHARLVDIVVR